VIRCKTMWFWK